MLALVGDQRADFLSGQRRRVAAMLDQFAEGLGVGIDVLEEFVAGVLPALQSACELADVTVAQRVELLRRLRTRPWPSSKSTIGTSLRGSRASASSAIRPAAMLAANSGWPVANSASCLTSSSAISSRNKRAVRISDELMAGKVMYRKFHV